MQGQKLDSPTDSVHYFHYNNNNTYRFYLQQYYILKDYHLVHSDLIVSDNACNRKALVLKEEYNLDIYPKI